MHLNILICLYGLGQISATAPKMQIFPSPPTPPKSTGLPAAPYIADAKWSVPNAVYCYLGGPIPKPKDLKRLPTYVTKHDFLNPTSFQRKPNRFPPPITTLIYELSETVQVVVDIGLFEKGQFFSKQKQYAIINANSYVKIETTIATGKGFYEWVSHLFLLRPS